jgi:predicted metal-dependent hydrolase
MNSQLITTIELGDITVEVVKKKIKNVHLRVYPPSGAVKISAPLQMSLDRIRIFATSKLEWIKAQQTRLRDQAPEISQAYVDRESHYLWGKPYLLKVIIAETAPQLKFSDDCLLLQVQPLTTTAQKCAIVDKFYRQQIEVALPPLISKWEQLMGVQTKNVTVRKMKTKWGSCTPALGTIRFNLELAKKPTECLEYVVVHELAHLIEPSHNHRFTALMDRFLPRWKIDRSELNRLAI